MAKTTNIGQLQTVYPHDFYPASQWKSDMLWGATEIALADESLGAPPPVSTPTSRWRPAGPGPTWHRRTPGRDTLNLYDPGAIGESELIKAMRAAHSSPIAPRTLLAGLAKQLRLGESRATAIRSAWAPSSAPATPRRTPSACSSPTPSTSRPAARPSTVASPSSSSTTTSARTPGAAPSSSAPATRSRTACSPRSPTCPAP